MDKSQLRRERAFIANQISLFTQKTRCGLTGFVSQVLLIYLLCYVIFFKLRPEHKMFSIKGFVYTDLQV